MRRASVLLLLLTGCGSPLPTFQYCYQVEYKRLGNQMELQAKCNAPIADPVPIVNPLK